MSDGATAARLLAIEINRAEELEMPYTGQTIENPVSGERITFLQTARNTAGEKLAGAVVENQRVGLGQRSTV